MSGVENPPAFPFPEVRDAGGCGIREGSGGMTLRDWFAGQALDALWPMQGGVVPGGDLDEQAETAAVWAYTIADAMLAARRSGDAA